MWFCKVKNVQKWKLIQKVCKALCEFVRRKMNKIKFIRIKMNKNEKESKMYITLYISLFNKNEKYRVQKR